MHTSPDTIEAVADHEKKLFEVRRHPFGLLLVYIEAAIGLVAGGILLFFLAPNLFSDATDSSRRFTISVIVGVVAIIIWLVLVLYTYIYRQSMLIITDKNLTQVLQKGLFNRKVSELSMSNVEDVTSHQRGPFSAIVGYGDLIVETAGEQDNFHFSYCPNPNYYGKLILDARQQYVDKHHIRN